MNIERIHLTNNDVLSSTHEDRLNSLKFRHYFLLNFETNEKLRLQIVIIEHSVSYWYII